MSPSDTIGGVGETHPHLEPPVLAALLAQLTHELKTPLHSILTVASILASEIDGPLTAEQRRQVSMIERNAHTLFELITELLSFSSVGARSIELRWEHMDVAALFLDIAESVEVIAAQKAMRLRRDLGNLPQSFVSDRFLLRQIVTNLLQNAVKYSPEGGDVWFTAFVDSSQRLNIDVADSGAGISVSEQPLVFDSFYQTPEGTSRRAGGVGLGLALVKASVKQLNGEVSVRSESERGALFHVEIPPGPEVIQEKREVVIIADRDQTVRLALTHVVSSAGFSPVSVSSAEDLARAFSSSGAKLALIDEEFLRQGLPPHNIKGGDILVIALSALDGPAEREVARKAGAVDFLVKPFDFAVVVSRLNVYGAKRSE